MYRFLVIIEKGDENFGAYSPDLPGCIAVGDTVEEVKNNMQEAIKMHLQGMIRLPERITPVHPCIDARDLYIFPISFVLP